MAERSDETPQKPHLGDDTSKTAVDGGHPVDRTSHPTADVPIYTPSLQRSTFLLLLALITVGFVWVLLPYYGGVFWGVVLGVLFKPVYRRLFAWLGRRRNLAALLSVLLMIVIVVLPLGLISVALIQQGTAVFQRIESGDIDFARYFSQVIDAMPPWVSQLLERFGFGDLVELPQRLISSIGQFGQQAARVVAAQAVGIGQNTVHFFIGLSIALYLAYFLLRDGDALQRRIAAAVPLDDNHRRALSEKFATVVRATVKGNVVVAIVQGVLGGIAFWFLGITGALLWAVLMALLSLLPAVGAGLVWFPVAIYMLATGATWAGIGLIVYGVGVIGLIDNLLRPLLVGKDTRMPDWLVLISTLGGLSIFGIDGFVIGPLIAALFIASWQIMADERAEVVQAGEPSVAPDHSLDDDAV